MRVKVLFVDDEPRILDGIRRLLYPLRQEFDAAFAGGGEEALLRIEADDYDAVVTDMRMPGVDGLALLTQVRERWPGMLRVVLSGHSDLEAMVRTAGVAHRYLSKPCTIDELRAATGPSIAWLRLLRQPALKSVLSGVDAVPSLPDSYWELMRAIDSPSVSVETLGDIVSRDIGMTSKLLHVCNSALFGSRRNIVSPAEAVAYLGTGIIRSLAVVVHVFQSFDGRSTTLSLKDLWQESLECSEMALYIAKSLKPGNKQFQDMTRSAALLRDVGRLVLACRMPTVYSETVEMSRRNKEFLFQAEQQVFGVCHAGAGACLLALWGLPEPIIEAVAHHHAPSETSSEEITPLTGVHLATGLVAEAHPDPSCAAPLDEAYLRRVRVADKVDMWRRAWEQERSAVTA